MKRLAVDLMERKSPWLASGVERIFENLNGHSKQARYLAGQGHPVASGRILLH